MPEYFTKVVIKTSILFLIAGVIGSVSGYYVFQYSWFCLGIILGALIALVAIIYHLTHFRCPYCHCYLSRYSAVFCQCCGKKLEEFDYDTLRQKGCLYKIKKRLHALFHKRVS